MMTTIKSYKFTCPECQGEFLSYILGSFGYRSVDEHLCKEYWGYNPMRFMLMMCPHCEHIGDPFDFESVEAPEDTDLPRASESCEKYEILAKRLIEEDEEANCLDIAYYFHQGACCRKVEQEDPVPLLKHANRYFRKAKEQGVESFGDADIDTLIERTDV